MICLLIDEYHIWIYGPNFFWKCQTAVIAGCVGGHVHILSYLFDQFDADFTLAGMYSYVMSENYVIIYC